MKNWQDPKFRSWLTRILGNVNKQSEENLLAVVLGYARQKAEEFIASKKLQLHELSGRKFDVRIEGSRVIFLTDDGGYACLEADCLDGWGSMEERVLGIETAHDLGVISNNLYKHYKAAEDAVRAAHDERTAQNAVRSAVSTLGREKVRELLDN